MNRIKHYIGIDLGTTVLKLATFEARGGKMVAQVPMPLRFEKGPDGKREQDPALLERAQPLGVGRLRRATGPGWGQVAGIGIAAQGGSTMIARREDGRPLTPLYLWNDMRALAHYQSIVARKGAAFWRSFSLRDDPGMGLARIEWLREREPELFSPENIYIGAGEYLCHLLTGEYWQDACHALQSGIYDARRERLTDKPLKALELGVGLDFFAPLRQGHPALKLTAAAAKRLVLPEGLPVAGPYNDHEAGLLAVTHLSGPVLQCSLGTAWVGNFILPRGMTGVSAFHLPIPSPLGEGRQEIVPLLTGNVTWDWALATFAHPDPQRGLILQDKIFRAGVLPPAGVVGLPWLNRPNPVDGGCLGAAGIFGAGPGTTRHDMLRAMAVGMVYEFGRVFWDVRTGNLVHGLALSGGASKGPHFQQLFAALFHPLPVRLVTGGEWMGTRGSLYSLDRLVARAYMKRIKLEPGIDRKALMEGFQRYRDSFERIYGDVAVGAPFQCKEG